MNYFLCYYLASLFLCKISVYWTLKYDYDFVKDLNRKKTKNIFKGISYFPIINTAFFGICFSNFLIILFESDKHK